MKSLALERPTQSMTRFYGSNEETTFFSLFLTIVFAMVLGYYCPLTYYEVPPSDSPSSSMFTFINWHITLGSISSRDLFPLLVIKLCLNFYFNLPQIITHLPLI